MITVRNEFETVPAYEHIAGSSLGTWTNRETTIALIKTLETTSNYDCAPLYKEMAETTDDDTDFMFETQHEVASYLDDYMPMPEFCSVVLDDNEWRVVPSIEQADDECKNFSDYPDTYQGDFILVTNDHGNVTCQQWKPAFVNCAPEYVTIWDMV